MQNFLIYISFQLLEQFPKMASRNTSCVSQNAYSKSWSNGAPANGAQYCQIQKNGDKHCHYPGPPARDGANAYRHYHGATGKDGQVFDIVYQPKHGRDAQCQDRPILRWDCPRSQSAYGSRACPQASWVFGV